MSEDVRQIDFAIVGGGWRTRFFLRVAAALPSRFRVSGVAARNPEKRAALCDAFGVDAFGTVDEMLAHTSPQFVVTAVSWAGNPPLLRALAERGIPALSETPPAPDLEGLIELNRLADSRARIQVAEQYFLVPHHAARLAVVASGAIGQPTQAQVSAAHGYHGISLIRKLLGLRCEPPKITAMRFTSPMVGWPDLDGHLEEERIERPGQDIAWLDFGDRLGVLDFTEPQYYSAIRNERVLVRGERGEIINDTVHYLKDFRTSVRLGLDRRISGLEDKVGGSSLKGIQLGADWVFVNPFAPAPMTVHEIAVASCLVRMDEYVRTGKEFYPLWEASQDHYLSLLVAQVIQSGQPVQATRQPWSV
ncbi:MAG: Gfo/Idh/MocA family protein [Armatimonadota bacterium]